MSDELAPLLSSLARILARALVQELRTELSKLPAPLPVPLAPDPLRVLRSREVSERVGLHRTTLYRMVQQKKFPTPIRLGEAAIGWREVDIVQWLNERKDRKR